MGSRPKFYIDSCVFIAWFKNEPRPFQEMAGIRALFDQIKKKQATLVGSTILLAELLFDKMPQAKSEFVSLQGLGNVHFFPVDLAIAHLAGEVRSYYYGKISVADSLHLATAIFGGCAHFYTFDEGKKGGHGLLKLGNQVAGYPLLVTKPFSAEPPLPGLDD